MKSEELRILFALIAALGLVFMIISYVRMDEMAPWQRLPRHYHGLVDHIDEEDHHPLAKLPPEMLYKPTNIPFIRPTPRKSFPKYINPAIKERTVAIGLGMTTRGQRDLKPENPPSELPFFRRLVLSFCQTASTGFEYHFYIGHDHSDPYFQHNISHVVFTKYFGQFIFRNCPKDVNVTLHLVECAHSGRPAWAQNDAMMAGYMDNMAYYYRVNDDTALETTGWTERMIEQLLRYNPPNVGVVGPWFRDGNTAILTHDFVHRTHIEIFGFYYPRIFTDWFADDWITGVYWPDRCKKVAGTRVKHTMEMGSRYVVHFEKANRVGMEVEIGKGMVNRYVLGREDNALGDLWSRNATNVISMTLYGNNPDEMFGVMRYAQLMPILLKGWRLRVYVYFNKEKETYSRLGKLLIKKLDKMGVEVVHIGSEVGAQIPPAMWRLLVADDLSVERFLVRNPDARPTVREMAALEEWLSSGRALHCIRDHPDHAHTPLVPQLIGGMPRKLRQIFGKSWRTLMRGYTSDIKFLAEVIWPQIQDQCLCHDSVSCTSWSRAKPYPVLRSENEYVGQHYDANDEAETVDFRSWNDTYNSPDCVFMKNTGFDELALRSIIKVRPVIWSQDYHVTPVMDIKSLLKPVGVKIIDKSLSYYCGQVGTCAKGLRIITRENGMRLTPEIMKQFYQVYKGDLDMNTVNAFVCTLPVAMCEAFMPFNKSIIVIATIRYEQGRNEPDKWMQLNQNLQIIAKQPRNLIAANNAYDQKYIEYFTGIKPWLIPNLCAYLKDSYMPSRKQFLVTPIHSTELSDKFYQEFDEAVIRHKLDVQVFPLRQLYPQYLFSDLAAHPGVVYIPYQVSMVSLTEQYRMNIPLFFPTLDLLASWHSEFQVVRQRTWAGYLGRRSSGSPIRGFLPIPDPNNDVDIEPIKHWLKYADFYQWPHIIYFKSVDDLVIKLANTDLAAVSKKMKEYNAQVEIAVKKTWSKIMLRIL